MKKLVLLAVALIATSVANAQDAEAKFRRSSLYTIKLDKQKAKVEEYKEATEIMYNAYGELPLPDAYNNFNMATRHIDYEVLSDVTAEEIAKYTGSEKKKGGGFGKFAKGLVSGVASSATGTEVTIGGGVSEEEYVTKLMKWFEADKTANKIVAKWHNKKGTDPAKVNWDDNLELLAEYGTAGMSEEDKALILENGGSVISAAKDNEIDVVPNTYVVVHRYSFMSGEEIFKEASAPIQAQLASASPVVALGLQKALDALRKKYATGYFVRCYAYLFQLEYAAEDVTGFYEKYWNKPADFANANYRLKYVGKSSGRARARKADDGNVVRVAMTRATDKCYADLQHDNEQFRPLAALHEVDGKLVAYIGAKEGVTEKSQFDVFDMKMDKAGRLVYNKVGSLKVQKGCVWDNRAGAGTADGDEGESDDDEEGDSNASLTYTTFVGKPGKIGDGFFIKLAK